MITIEQIKEALRQHIAEAEAATPGPWEEDDGHIHSQPLCSKEEEWLRSDSEGDRPETEVAHCSQEFENFDSDATFIAHARTMSPAACKCLLQTIEWLEEDCEMNHHHQQIAQNRLEQIRQEWHNQTK